MIGATLGIDNIMTTNASDIAQQSDISINVNDLSNILSPDPYENKSKFF